MAEMVRERNREDALRLSAIFSEISEESKGMVFAYLSALRDKEIADSGKQSQEV